MSRLVRLLLVATALVAALALAACGDDDDDDSGDSGSDITSVEALPSSSCSEIEYGGEGEPDALIASDLPKLGDSAVRTEQMNDAIRLVLEDNDWKAGDTNVAFQTCDDSIEETGEWDEKKCQDNANAYSANPDVIGVVGTYNSGCAAEIIPILNEAPDGGLAMVSPGNTLICLTESAPTCEDGTPNSLYPSGTRNYARVVPNDAFQGAGLATYASEQGVKKPYVLYAADDPVSKGQGDTFAGAAGGLGMEVVGNEPWDEKAASYTDLMNKAKAAGADAVLLAGLLDQNGAQLIKDKVAVLGPNDGAVKLLAPDGFAQQATIDDTGPDSAGMIISAPGASPDSLTGEGQTLVSDLDDGLDGDTPVEVFAPYAGQAAQVLLAAAAQSPARGDIVTALTKTRIDGGIIGSFSITGTGDPSTGTISISVAADTLEDAAQIVPTPELVDAARGG